MSVSTKDKSDSSTRIQASLEKLASICTNLMLELQQAGTCLTPEVTHLLDCLAELLPVVKELQTNDAILFTLGQLLHEHIAFFIKTDFPLATDDLELASEYGDVASKFLHQERDKISAALLAQAQTLLDNISTRIMLVHAEAPQQTEQDATVAEISPEEQAAFEKFNTRSENLFLLNLPAGSCKSLEDLSAHSAIDALSRVADLFVQRVHPNGSLVLLAAELDGEMLSTIAGAELIAVQKSPDCIASRGGIWSQLTFAAPAPSHQAPVETKIEESVSKEAQEFAQQVKLNVQAVPEAPAAATPSEPAEDFDSANNATFDIASVDPEMLQDFLTNADELMEKLSQSILELESDPNNKESIEQIFRTAHTIKGTAGMFGFKATERLTHVMENMFDKVRKGQLVATSSHIDAILFGFDRVRKMFEELKQNRSPELKINDALQNLHAAMRGEQVSTATRTEPPKTESQTPSAKVETSPAPTKDEPKDPPAKAAQPNKGEGTIRVDLRRLDSLVNLVGELVIDRTRFLEIEEELRARSENGDLLHAMSEAVLHFGRHMNEVQGIIMKIRMVPIGNTLTKFTRVVRDLARDCGKEVELNIEGGEAELDKTLVEELHDPLVHLIRNSIDHGIELPDDRAAAGKKRKGRIDITAAQDSNMIVIKLKDDGRGLQVDKIRNKAVQQGIIKENEVLSNKEIFNLIFEAGFSTAEKVTNISGRGVGMDVVKKSILRLKGVIEIDSAPGNGTTTIIKLPLTLAIIPSLMVDTVGESFAIPLVNVIESIRISPDEIQRIGSADFVRLRDHALPLFRMSDIFALENLPDRIWYKTTPESLLNSNRPNFGEDEAQHSSAMPHRATMEHRRKRPRIIFVVVGVGEKRIGIVVDQLLGQQEIVIKPLGSILGKPRGIAGGCVLGNGRVALVLDAGEIVDDVSRGRIGG